MYWKTQMNFTNGSGCNSKDDNSVFGLKTSFIILVEVLFQSLYVTQKVT